MTDDFTSETLAYLLDELDAGRRAQFEQRLARDTAAEAAFKACADSFAEFVLTQAPGQPISGDARERMLAAVMRTTEARRGSSHNRWRNYLWPMAAAALLALNVFQWVFGHREPSVIRLTTTAGEKAKEGAFTRDTALVAAKGADGSRGVSQVFPEDTKPEVMEILERLSVLRRENDHLQESNTALNAETERLSQQLAVLTAANSGTTRLVAIELVDAASYASGNRNGLVDLAKTILTTPGVVAASPASATNSAGSNPGSTLALNQTTGTQTGLTTSFGGTSTVTGSGSLTLVDPSSLTGTTIVNSGTTSFSGATISGGTTSVISGLTGTTTLTANTSGTSPVSTGTFPSEAPPTTEPYAWSVFDASQSQGYLNLYNLPTVSSGQSLQLWVQPVGSNTFENVGAIPSQYYGGSGSVYYKLGTQSAIPSQILITVEPSQAVPTKPTGTVVVRGP